MTSTGIANGKQPLSLLQVVLQHAQCDTKLSCNCVHTHVINMFLVEVDISNFGFVFYLSSIGSVSCHGYDFVTTVL